MSAWWWWAAFRSWLWYMTPVTRETMLRRVTAAEARTDQVAGRVDDLIKFMEEETARMRGEEPGAAAVQARRREIHLVREGQR